MIELYNFVLKIIKGEGEKRQVKKFKGKLVIKLSKWKTDKQKALKALVYYDIGPLNWPS